MRRELRCALTDLAYIRESLGRVETRQTAAVSSARLSEVEFRVFSQSGEDGIIQYLIRNIPVAEKTFVEFGVEAYREANTRFLLMHDNWRGMIIDGSQANMDAVKSEELYWRHTLKAVCSFITPSNIDSLLLGNGFSGPIGLLSIDIDGMDYWVWKNIKAVSPAIVVVEYNARFGPQRSVTVPLDENFTRSAAHYSNIYYGVSLAALVKLANEKGYACVGCNSYGNNAFFVRLDLMPPGWKKLTSSEAFVPCRFRESRTPQGNLAFLTDDEEAALLETLTLVEV